MSNEVTSSVNMEMEGLMRSPAFFENNGLKVDTLVTDQHTRITKYMREKYPEVTHYFNVCHVVKCKLIYKRNFMPHKLFLISFGEKKEALTKEKDCSVIGEWLQSVVNHLYW